MSEIKLQMNGSTLFSQDSYSFKFLRVGQEHCSVRKKHEKRTREYFSLHFVFHGSKVSVPANPEKEATAEYTYAFAGWFNGETAWDFESVVECDITLTAKFTASDREYTLTITYADGSATQTKTYLYGDMADLDFAREGYTFTVTLNGTEITELQIIEDAEIIVAYTLIQDSSVDSGDNSSIEESSSRENFVDGGCVSSLGSVPFAFLAVLALAFVAKKRK